MRELKVYVNHFLVIDNIKFVLANVVKQSTPRNSEVQRNNTFNAPRNTNTRSTTVESTAPARNSTTPSAPRTSEGGGTLRR